MATLERAIAIAAEAHTGQTDRGKAPYILHPLRVMLAVQHRDERIAAVLHDVVEDCFAWPLERLRSEGFSETVLEAIDALTKRPGEDYDAFIRRAGQNTIARAVKLADLADNRDISRIKNPTEKDWDRLTKYGRATTALARAADNEKTPPTLSGPAGQTP